MVSVEVLTAVLALLAGVGAFLTGCGLLSGGMEALAGDRLRTVFAGGGRGLLPGVALGAAGTALIQSSGAATALVVGFADRGLLSLRQAAALIYGANIGTTVTGQLAALGLLGRSALSPAGVFSALTGVGALLTLLGSGTGKRAGDALTGFGLLFIGLELLAGSMDGLAGRPEVRHFLAGLHSPLLLTALGAALTAAVQSSSVVTAVCIAMLGAGLLGPDQGICLTLGSNVGACVAALLAGLSGGVNARRTALLHLLFNLLGVGAFLSAWALLHLFSRGSLSPGGLLFGLLPAAPGTCLAAFHTLFNLVTAALALPLTDGLVALACRLVPGPRTAAQ